ncbi:hypothetical protein AKJ16_DCAP01809 [Drosera capensis]
MYSVEITKTVIWALLQKRVHKFGNLLDCDEGNEDIRTPGHSRLTVGISDEVKMLTVCQSKKDSIDVPFDDAMKAGYRCYQNQIDFVCTKPVFRLYDCVARQHSQNYWRDFDTALFILKHLYRDIPEEKEPLPRQTSSALSDSLLIRGFSWKGKKTNKGPFNECLNVCPGEQSP